jgi:hypothetical protein
MEKTDISRPDPFVLGFPIYTTLITILTKGRLCVREQAKKPCRKNVVIKA